MINAEEVKRLKESYDPVGVALASTSAQYTHGTMIWFAVTTSAAAAAAAHPRSVSSTSNGEEGQGRGGAECSDIFIAGTVISLAPSLPPSLHV